MLSRLTGKKRGEPASTQREAILRGIYDQNRGLRAPARPVRRPRRGLGRSFLAVLAVMAAVVGVQILPASGQSREGLLAIFAPPAKAPALPVAMEAPSPVVEVPAAAQAPAAPEAPPSLVAVAADAPASTLPVAHEPDVTPEQPRALALATPPLAGVKAVELADVVPVLSDKENLRNLFGLAVRTIVVDAGHGGHDPGALGKTGTREKDITLDVAQRLKDKLEASGYRVIMVRDEDVFVPLKERAGFANSHDTDLFVSIHVNYLPSTSTNAVETYYFGRHQDARTRKLAERENQGSEYSLSEFEGVMRNVQDTIKLQESQALAHAIQGSLLASIRAQNKKVLDNGVRSAPFMVLLGVKAPSVLVEIGSLSSPEAEQNLRKDNYRDEIASFVAAGIGQYLNEQLPQEREIHEQDKSRLAEQR